MDDSLIPLSDVSRQLRRSERTLIRWMEKGQLPGCRLGKGYVIPRRAYDEWLASQYQRAVSNIRQNTERAGAGVPA